MYPFGRVQPPPGVNQFAGGSVGGIAILINIIFRTLIIGAGIFAIFNFILAGYGYLSAGGDPKKISDAGSKITMSVIGLTVAASAFLIAGLLGLILFGDAGAILNFGYFQPR